MDFDEWLSQQRAKDRNRKHPQYKHFDLVTTLSKKVEKYISNPDKICQHGFYPFLHYVKKSCKFRKKDVQKHCKDNWATPKERLCELLQVPKLPEDYYKIFKSLTRYSYVEIEDINAIQKMERNREKTSTKILEKKQFRN